MSARKRKTSSNFKELYESINGVLARIKPKLIESAQTSCYSPSLCEDLHQIAALAQALTNQRSRANKDWISLADVLDREGVYLWNLSASIRECSDDDNRPAVFAALRLAGFRLIEAGLEQKPGIETLIHVLQLASKAGSSLSDAGSSDLATSVLGSAAKYEEALRNAQDPQHAHVQARVRATVMYYCSRMEAAFKEGNEGVANFMLHKATENVEYLTLLLSRERELLAAKILAIGKSLLKAGSHDVSNSGEARRAIDSVKWIQKAFAIVDHSESENAGSSELKRSILRSLARAYFLSSSDDPENLVRAEASLHELISSIDASVDHTKAEFQQLRWMRIAVLRKRKAAQNVIIDAFRSIIDHMDLSDVSISDILQELRTFGHDHALVSTIHHHCLLKILEVVDESTQQNVDRILLPLILHCAKDQTHAKAMDDVRAALTCLSDANFEITKISATACVTLLWQCGDRHYRARNWGEAADWFLAGTHPVFSIISPTSDSKCYRKAALCHIQQKEYAKASAVIRRCAHTEAATCYVLLLVAVHQGLEDEAIDAIRSMVIAPDFDRKMLMLATRLANESEMKALLLSALEALLDVVKIRQGPATDVEALTLIRCIIRLVLKLLAEPGPNRMTLIAVLVKHFLTATTLVARLDAKHIAPTILKDLSWLWRTAYNCAVQGCTEWANSEESVSQLFDTANQLLKVYLKSTLTDVDPEVHMFLLNASFAGVMGKVFSIRDGGSKAHSEQMERMQILSDNITACKKEISEVVNNVKSLQSDDFVRSSQFLRMLWIFETEMLCHLGEWDKLRNTIEEVVKSDTVALNTLEAIADTLWIEESCPVEVLFMALEAILHAALDHDLLSVEKFSRWLRATCTILLSKNTSADRLRAIGYVEQAITVMGEHSAETENQIYPMDERHWLLGTSYNAGVECLHSSLLDEAKRWFEVSTTICRFVLGGAKRAEKISETYSRLLTRCATDSRTS
ncbi:hypothetical protein BKA93DRAFT_799652 [Sparassis latifolia]|uniref:Protein ZIP4 homolog n=1 Tax=Sparassis crispa TaxID=139825 RepID=A0A401G8R5_9APHY|nr:hypothetical protein SCP_0114590 [Sparassis crispa]GBE78570.1 hypothetical protein SCP_0114590 [Sparassis crispa]